MKREVFVIYVALITLLFSCNKSNRDIINKSISKLKSLETIEYKVVTHYLQTKVGADKIDTAICFFDFTSKDTLLGARYHFNYRYGEQVFNGIQEFSSDIVEKRILFRNEPRKYNVSNSIFMLHSIYALRKLLPEIVNDSTTKITRLNDTIINSKDNYQFNIAIARRAIDIGFKLNENKKKGFFSNYNLIFSKKDYLPIQFTWVFPENNGYLKNYFKYSSIPSERADSIWSYERFPKEFLRLSYKEFFERMNSKASTNIGKQAPIWTLPVINGDSIKLSGQKGKLVLLEFWFPYCVGCVQSIPAINEIHKKYSAKGLNIYGVEFSQDNEKGLVEYIEKQKIEYPTLYNGKGIAKDYGVNAAPTFFLIDKRGKIIYTSIALKKNELISAIDKNLN